MGYITHGIYLIPQGNIGANNVVTGLVYDMSEYIAGFTNNDSPETTALTTIANGSNQTADAKGSVRFNGQVDLNAPVEFMAAYANFVIANSAQTDYVAPAWATTTAHQKDDVVSKTGGGYFVAQNAGTTGATEPTATTDKEIVTDGTVKWMYRGVLKSSTHEFERCKADQVCIYEIKKKCDGTEEIKYAQKARLGYMTFSKTDGTGFASASIPFVAEEGSSTSRDNFQAFDLSGATIIKFDSTYYANINVRVTVGTSEVVNMTNFELPFTRQFAESDRAEEFESIYIKENAPTLEGSATIELNPSQYEEFRKVKFLPVEVEMNYFDGNKCVATFPEVQFKMPTVEMNGNEEQQMAVQMKAIGNTNTPMVSLEIRSTKVI